MWFDAKAALEKIRFDEHPIANPAISATSAVKRGLEVATIAEVAVGSLHNSRNVTNSEQINEELVLEAIRDGVCRHGAVASRTNLGGTFTYNLIDKLIAEGRIHQAFDGQLSAEDTTCDQLTDQ